MSPPPAAVPCTRPPGCRCGHGTLELARISGAQVTGIDIQPECLEYARTYYDAENIRYELIEDIFDYARSMPKLELRRGDTVWCAKGPEVWHLRANVKFDVTDASAVARFTLKSGERRHLAR